jgi:hypothetical protein
MSSCQDTEKSTGDNVINASEVTPQYRRYGGQELEAQAKQEFDTMKAQLSGLAEIMGNLELKPSMLKELDYFEQVFVAVMALKLQMMIPKQKDYKSGNIEKLKVTGILKRMGEKIERAYSLIGDPDEQINAIKQELRSLADDASSDELDHFVYNIDKIVNPSNAVQDEKVDDTLMDSGNYGDIAYTYYHGAWGKPLENV